MKAYTTLLLLAFAAACATGPEPELAPDDLGVRLGSDDAAVRAEAAEEAYKTGAEGVAIAGDLLAHENPDVKKTAERALWRIAHHASRPGTNRERRRVSRELIELLDRPVAPNTVLHMLAVTASGEASVARVARALDDPETADAALFALERITHASAEKALIKALWTEHRASAARALGVRRSRNAVPDLIKLAATEAAAREALARIADPRAEETLRAAAFERREKGATLDLLRYADLRTSAGQGQEVASIFGKLAAVPDAHIRAAAVRGIGRIGGPAALWPLITALKDDAPAVRAVAREGLAALDAPGVTPSILTMFEEAEPETKVEILRVIVAREETKALELVRRSVQAPEPVLRLAALDLAGDYADKQLEPILVEAAKSEMPEEARVAQASCLRRARTYQKSGRTKKALTMYYQLADTSSDARVVRRAIEGMAATGDPDSLVRLDALAVKGSHRVDVDRARITIAAKLVGEDRNRAVLILDQVCKESPSRGARRNAALKLTALGVDTSAYARRQGFLVDWKLAGPYPKYTDADWNTHPFHQKKPGEGDAWKAFRTLDTDGVTDLLPHFEKKNNVVAYAYAEFDWPEYDDAVLKLGSDDGIVVWLNGEQVHSNAVARGIGIDQDQARCQLKKGTNQILVKISQGGGDWGFCVRLCDVNGKPVDLTGK